MYSCICSLAPPNNPAFTLAVAQNGSGSSNGTFSTQCPRIFFTSTGWSRVTYAVSASASQITITEYSTHEVPCTAHEHVREVARARADDAHGRVLALPWHVRGVDERGLVLRADEFDLRRAT